MRTSKHKAATAAPLSHDLVHFYDDFSAFQESCAFFCEACAALAADNEGFDAGTAHGLGRNALQLKHQGERLREQLKDIQRKAHAQNRADK